jgi:glycosyltransferase involved in cell wall biosynthesis
VSRVRTEALATEARARSSIKELFDSETGLMRTVEALQAEARFGHPDHAEVYRTPSWDRAEPDVTVILTSFNYSQFIGDAVRSVMASAGVELELLIVDDHSSDGSVAAVRAIMDDHPWFPIELVALAANGGVARARNMALDRARSELLFVLDADNTVYPTGIAKLAAALETTKDAVFAYGIVPRTDGAGLLNQYAWDVPLLCQYNYIDAMAMVRRSILQELGGYDAHFGLRGWEDYELWLRVAAAGGEPVHVREIVASYRVHSTSRRATMDLDTATIGVELRARYPDLPWSRDE